jgi:ankyrin repeat protein
MNVNGVGVIHFLVLSLIMTTPVVAAELAKVDEIVPSVTPEVSSAAAPLISSSLIDAAKNGNLSEVKKWLACDAQIDAVDYQFGRTALAWAVQNGHAQVVEALLRAANNQINKRDKFETSPLGIAIAKQDCEMVELLSSTDGIDLQACDLVLHETPLDYAARLRDDLLMGRSSHPGFKEAQEIVRILVRNGATRGTR